MKEPNLWHNLYVEAAHGVCLSALQANASAYVHLHGNVIVAVVAFVTLPSRCASHILCVRTYLCTHYIPIVFPPYVWRENVFICIFVYSGATLPIINMAACNGPTNKKKCANYISNHAIVYVKRCSTYTFQEPVWLWPNFSNWNWCTIFYHD